MSSEPLESLSGSHAPFTVPTRLRHNGPDGLVAASQPGIELYSGAVVEFANDLPLGDLERNREVLFARGYSSHAVATQNVRALVITDIATDPPRVRSAEMHGFKRVVPIDDPLKFVSRNWKESASEIAIGDVRFGAGTPQIMLGPCAVQNEDQLRAIATFLRSRGIRVMRAGAFKPRSTPYVFRGLGQPGLELLRRVADEYGLLVISEVTECAQLDAALPFIDIIQIGTRNAQNFELLSLVGRCGAPVLLKRGFGNTIAEFLGAAEYIFAAGNEQILLCERGIRTFESSYRNTFDINAIIFLKMRSHLPVIADPSHGFGSRRAVIPLSLAAIAAGADGLLVEVSDAPDASMTDAAQTISLESADCLIHSVRKLTTALPGSGDTGDITTVHAVS